jgi:hypothetical protein
MGEITDSLDALSRMVASEQGSDTAVAEIIG